jgi:hypothetical protein
MTTKRNAELHALYSQFHRTKYATIVRKEPTEILLSNPMI